MTPACARWRCYALHMRSLAWLLPHAELDAAVHGLTGQPGPSSHGPPQQHALAGSSSGGHARGISSRQPHPQRAAHAVCAAIDAMRLFRWLRAQRDAPGADSYPRAVSAVLCLTANLTFYSLSYGGFHAHLQDVCGARAGVLQGVTNSASILAGLLGSLLTGCVVEMTGTYTAVFQMLAALYVVAAVIWGLFSSSHMLGHGSLNHLVAVHMSHNI
ncbi:hypothetical protein COO60DRAFT_48662 [Scenedesmus sp. NREL 46B-D3]|nr:hypothetical protein COO60DRAFT_48662 [Scenedesmus sp. NREL 46B-D3]